MSAPPPLWAAAAPALARLALEHPDLVLLSDDAGPGAWLARAWPRRAVAAPGGAARLATADGIGLAGQRAVVALRSGAAVALPGPVIHGMSADGDPPPLLVVSDMAQAVALWGAGWRVVTPAWPADVAPHLADIVAARTRTVILLGGPTGSPHGGYDEPPVDAPPLGSGSQRVLAAGDLGLVVGAGAAVPRVRAAAAIAARRGVPLRVVERHTWQAPAVDRPCASPAIVHWRALVGRDPDADVADPIVLTGLRPVVVDPESAPRILADALLGALPASR